jgi:glycosyltransferase involved in cell wall biosynthesis
VQSLPILEAVLDRCPSVALRLIGRGASHARAKLLSQRPADKERILVADGLALDEVACQIASCDVLVQPYLDGVSSRRTSFMAGLALGIASVTHAAESTEPLWVFEAACVLVNNPSPEAYSEATAMLLSDDEARHRLGERAREVYEERFHIRHVVARLREPSDRRLDADNPALSSSQERDRLHR